MLKVVTLDHLKNKYHDIISVSLVCVEFGNRSSNVIYLKRKDRDLEFEVSSYRRRELILVSKL